MESVTVRAANQGDATAINQIYNHYICHTSITFDVEPWTLADRQKWMDGFLRQRTPHHLLVAESAGEVAGFACNVLFRPKAAYRQSTETTVYTDHRNPAQGIGRGLYRELFRLIAVTDLHRAYAVIALPNDRSMEFHEKFGFRHIGTLTEAGRKFDRYVDVAWYEKVLR